jgi:predicted  nucleic acid-binding Zn-ribbon protein
MTVAKPTHEEIIRELTKEVAILNERLNSVREDVKELKRQSEETSKNRWALLPPIIGAIVSVLLSALVTYLIARK